MQPIAMLTHKPLPNISSWPSHELGQSGIVNRKADSAQEPPPIAKLHFIDQIPIPHEESTLELTSPSNRENNQ
jgi:hypothetical protein